MNQKHSVRYVVCYSGNLQCRNLKRYSQACVLARRSSAGEVYKCGWLIVKVVVVLSAEWKKKRNLKWRLSTCAAFDRILWWLVGSPWIYLWIVLCDAHFVMELGKAKLRHNGMNNLQNGRCDTDRNQQGRLFTNIASIQFVPESAPDWSLVHICSFLK